MEGLSLARSQSGIARDVQGYTAHMLATVILMKREGNADFMDNKRLCVDSHVFILQIWTWICTEEETMNTHSNYRRVEELTIMDVVFKRIFFSLSPVLST